MLLVAQGKHTAHARIKWRVRMSNKRGWAYPGWLGCLTAVGPNRSCVLRTQSALTAFCFPPLPFRPGRTKQRDLWGPSYPFLHWSKIFSSPSRDTPRPHSSIRGTKFSRLLCKGNPFAHHFIWSSSYVCFYLRCNVYTIGARITFN